MGDISELASITVVADMDTGASVCCADDDDDTVTDDVAGVVGAEIFARWVVVSSDANGCSCCSAFLCITFMQSLCCSSGISSAFNCLCTEFMDIDSLSSRVLSIFVDLCRFVVTFLVLFISSIFLSLEICKDEEKKNKISCYFINV